MSEKTRGHSLDTLLIAERFPPRLSGRSSLLRELVANLPADRTVVSTPGHREAKGVDRTIPADVRRSPRLLFGSGALGRRLWCSHLEWTLRRRTPGLVVAFDVRPDGEIARDIHRKRGVPYLLHLDAPRLVDIRRRLAKGGEGAGRLRQIVDDAAGIVTSSQTCYLEAYRLGVLPHLLEVVPAGVDLKRFHPGERPAERAEQVGVKDGPVLLTVVGGSRGRGRDLETVLRAFSVVRGQHREATLVIVGREEPRPWKKVLRQLKIDRAVRFIGVVPAAQMPEWYRLADALIMAHRPGGETGPVQGVEVSLLEALASGLPVLATRTPATEEFVPTNEIGQLVDPGAHAKLGKAAAALLHDRDEALAMGEAARRHAEEVHDSVRCGEMFRELLEVIYFRRLGLGQLEPAPGIAAAGSARPAA